MKSIFLALFVCLLSATSIAQVAFTIFEPASIAGGYEFTSNGDADNWGLANLDDPADAVTASVIISDDGTPGINAQGIPHANEGCAPIINDLTGKIALLYRYDGASDNDCYGGTKVLNAQNAGAIGVIMVNRDNSVYGYNGTADGPATSIPFAFVTKDDGAIIRERIEAGEDVIAFIGNKLELFDNDAGIVAGNTMAPSISAAPAQLSLNGTEFGFDLGTTIYNYGSNTQSNIMLTATVTGPSETWTETVGPFEIETGDSVNIYTGGTNDIPHFSFDTYPEGAYSLNYAIEIGTTDESSFDNNIAYNFIVSNEMITYCKIDETTNSLHQNRASRSGSSTFSPCIAYENPNASRIGASGIHFLAESAWNVDLLLEGEEIGIFLYEWGDPFADLEDPGFGFTSLENIAEATYKFGEGEEGELVYAAFEEPVLLEDDQRYLACVQVWNPDIWIGYNSQIDYARNVATYLQPMSPIETDGDYFALGFGEEMTPMLALAIFDAGELSIADEEQNANVLLYPNPTTEVLNVVFEDTEKAETIKIMDLSGRVVQTISNVSAINQIDVSNLVSGQYILVTENGTGVTGHYKFSKL